MLTSPRVMHRAFLNRDVPLPADALFAAPPERFRSGDAHGVHVPSQFCSCPPDFGAFPLVIPHMPSMSFHLDAVFFSRDRPTDAFFHSSDTSGLMPDARRFRSPTNELHKELGRSRKLTSASGYRSSGQSASPPSSAWRRDPALGLASCRHFGHSVVRWCVLEYPHQPSASAGRFRPAIRSWVSVARSKTKCTGRSWSPPASAALANPSASSWG